MPSVLMNFSWQDWLNWEVANPFNGKYGQTRVINQHNSVLIRAIA